MRVFLIWPDRYNSIEGLIAELKKRSHQIVYWVGLFSDKAARPGMIFHDHYFALAGVPAPGIDISEFPAIGEDLIKYFHKTESLILTMMNKHFDTICLDERKHIYYNMLRYWYGAIKKYQPQLIIFNTVPHTVYNYIIYELAKFLGIKTIMFEDSWVSDRLLCYTDWREGSPALKRELQNNRLKNFSLKDLSEDIREYYQFQTDGQHDTAPLYAKYIKQKFSGRKSVIHRAFKIITTEKKEVLLKIGIRYIIKQFKPDLRKEYQGLQREPSFSRPFVYVPLGFQPERMISPQGDVFVDQLLMIELLSYCLPDGWLLFVKEHPSQWWLCARTNYSSNRYPGYYQSIARIKNVLLVPLKTDSFTLINKSRAVVTVSGVSGWEAVLRSKPAMIFGYPWYRDCPSVFRVKEVESCRSAFQKIIAGHCPKQQDVINYLKSFDQATFHGYVEGLAGKNSQLTPEENISNITRVILTEIDN